MATSISIGTEGSFVLNDTSDDEDASEEVRVVETDPNKRFERYDLSLGKGAYKEVFKAFDQERFVEVAWNQLRIDNLPKRDAQYIVQEINLLTKLRNDHIITMYDAWVSTGPNGKYRVVFITELMTSGSVKSYIKKSKGPVKPKVVKDWCRQILLGLEYLHSRNPPVIHRDLKAENIFINGNNGQAKIGDLGLAIEKHREHISSVLGTPEFMAPELYEERYDEKVDIYAFGMVILEIVTKEYPYSECSNQPQIYRKVMQGIKPAALTKIMDEETRQFVDLCIQHDPKLRPSASELLKHPFLAIDLDLTSATQSIDFASNANNSPQQLQQTLLPPIDPPNITVVQPTPSPIPPTTSISQSICIVHIIEREPTGVLLKMVYFIPGKPSKEAKFMFHFNEDTAANVVSEMVKENLIESADEMLARQRLEDTLKNIDTIDKSMVNNVSIVHQPPPILSRSSGSQISLSQQSNDAVEKPEDLVHQQTRLADVAKPPALEEMMHSEAVPQSPEVFQNETAIPSRASTVVPASRRISTASTSSVIGPETSFKRAIIAARDQGFGNLQIRPFTFSVVLPTLGIGTALIVSPSLIVLALDAKDLMSFDFHTHFEKVRLMYPVFALILLLAIALRLLFQALKQLMAHMHEEEYVIRRRLHNLGEGVPAPQH